METGLVCDQGARILLHSIAEVRGAGVDNIICTEWMLPMMSVLKIKA